MPMLVLPLLYFAGDVIVASDLAADDIDFIAASVVVNGDFAVVTIASSTLVVAPYSLKRQLKTNSIFCYLNCRRSIRHWVFSVFLPLP